MKNVSKSTNITVKIGLLSAIALILMFFEFPILPNFSFLKMDLSDMPALIGALALGPLCGILIEAIKNILIILVRGTQSGGIGEFANFLIGSAFVVTSALIYKRNKTKKMAVISLVAAIIVMSVVGIFANYFMLIPLFCKGMTSKAIMSYVIYGIVPFNIIKGIVISVVTMLVYKRVSVLIHIENINKEKCNKTA